MPEYWDEVQRIAREVREAFPNPQQKEERHAALRCAIEKPGLHERYYHVQSDVEGEIEDLDAEAKKNPRGLVPQGTVPDDSDDDLSPAGFKGGQGRTGQDLENDANGCLLLGPIFLVFVVMVLTVNLGLAFSLPMTVILLIALVVVICRRTYKPLTTKED